ncbi:MAG: secondary thiamine-phosphate synthase enzyme YjbQ [Candidatus Rifleibacteriota bacterium]
MTVFTKKVYIKTNSHQGLFDITTAVKQVVKDSGSVAGICNVYVRGATAAIMIQENWDQSVQNDVISLLSKLIPAGVWEHDAQDGNGDSHLKSGLIGPSETIPVIESQLALSTWQNIFVCEFDGPREQREIVVTVIS